MNLVLDTGVLGQVCHPRKHREVRSWLGQAVAVHTALVAEIADYELRRELLRIRATRSLAHLDELGRELGYVHTTTAMWRHAAELWAQRRQHGRPSADTAGLDGDVLMAAQALAAEASVVTTNVKHFDGLVDAMVWRDVPLSH